MSLFAKCADHLSLIHAMAEAYPPHEISEESAEAYLLALYDVPLEHCAKAAVELIRKHDETDFIPGFGRWRSCAVDFWNEAIRREQSERQRIGLAPPTEEDKAAARRELHRMILERANGGDTFWTDLAARMANFGKKPYVRQPSLDERMAELDADLEREMNERLAKLTPEQLEARRKIIERAYGPNKYKCGSLCMCGGCGRTIRGEPAYTSAEVDLCGTCALRYSWSRPTIQEIAL